MRKKANRLLSLLLVVAMLATVFCSSAFAAGSSRSYGYGSSSWWNSWNWWGWSEPEPDPEPAAEEPAEPDYPALAVTEIEAGLGVYVSINAPEGAFPDGTAAEFASNEEILTRDQAKIEESGIEGNLLVAVDISFKNGDEYLQPADGNKVEVTLSGETLQDRNEDDLVVVHVGETAEEVDRENWSYADGKVVISADSFSDYTVLLNAPVAAEATEEEVVAAEAPEEEVVAAEAPEEEVVAAEAPAEKIVTEEYETPDFRDAGDSTSTPASDNDLNLTKTVVPNGDGTYKVSLSITGKVNQESQTTSTSANVILVLDVSTSMSQSFGTGTRLDAVKSAANSLVDAMPNAANVDMAVVSFGGSVTTNVGWTTVSNDTIKSQIKTTISGLGTNQGTDWPAALSRANTLATDRKNSGDNDPVYVIFLTDGCPTTRAHNHGSSGTTNVDDTCISNSLTNMTTMVTNRYNVYGIYANTTSDATRPRHGNSGTNYVGTYTDPLQYVIDQSGAGAVSGDATHYFKADNAEALNDVFDALVSTITQNLNYTDNVIDDGVTDLSHNSASTAVAGAASGFTYTKGGEPWAGAPEAKVENGSVIWDLGTMALENNVTYTVSFDIWPSQESYNLLADINNAISRADDGTITEYETPDKAYASLSDDVKNQIYKDTDGVYKLKTNTHLTNSYTYNGTSYTYTPSELTNGAMPLAAEDIILKKLWPENMLDKYGEAVYRDEEGNEYTASEITLTLTQNDNKYLDVTVGKDNGWESGSIYLSCGVMTVKDGVVAIKEEGYDYTVTEPAAFSYYWDLISPIYHPMVINGTATILERNDKATGTDGVNYYTIKGHKYVATSNATTLQASNYRRSNLNLTKTVSTGGGENHYFTYTAKVTDSNSSDGYVWFSAWDPVANTTVKDSEWIISGATAETDDNGVTGYWYAENGSEIQFKIKAGWNVRFLNLYHGSTFSFEETAMPDNYEFEGVAAAARYAFMDSDYTNNWYEIDDENTDLITGTIVEPNNQYTVTYTNKATAAFYVYHSATCEVEKIFFSDNRLIPASGGGYTFNIVDETNDGYLYGGYFSKYATSDDDAVRALEFNNNKATYSDVPEYKLANARTGLWVRANAYTQNGAQMHPVANGVYYLKEVNEAYLTPYMHFVYNVDNGKVTDLCLLTAIDDTVYRSAGYQVDDTYIKGTISNQMSITNGWEKATVTPSGVNSAIQKGYISGVRGSKMTNILTYGDSLTINKSEFTITPSWVTMDNVPVTGKARAVDLDDGTYTNIKFDGVTAFPG